MNTDRVQEVAQKLYQEDGHSGNIYKKAKVSVLRYYETKTLKQFANGTVAISW